MSTTSTTTSSTTLGGLAVTVGSERTVTGFGGSWETTATVVAPGTQASTRKCPSGGRLVISDGRGGFSTTPGQVNTDAYYALNLDGSGSPTDLTPAYNTGIPAAPTTPVGVSHYQPIPATDNQIATLLDGTLLGVRATWIDTPGAALNAATDTPALWWNGTSGGRAGLLFMQSSDCGASWQARSLLDPATVRMPDSLGGLGACAWPQTDDAAGKHYLQGGVSDREEMYVDPFQPNTVYVTVRCTGNTDVKGNAVNPAHTAVDVMTLFASHDGGMTWGTDPAHPAPTQTFAGWEPVVMTSLPSKRLFLFQCIGGTPALSWTDDDGVHLHQPIENLFNASQAVPGSQPCAGAPDVAPITSLGTDKYGGIALARDVASQSVLVAYPSVEQAAGGAGLRQVERLVFLHPGGGVLGNDPEHGTISTVEPENASGGPQGGHIFFATFIEMDASAPSTQAGHSTALLYWLEGSAGKLFARGKVIRDGQTMVKALDLSTNSQRGPVPVLGANARHTWSYAATGDYVKGAFYAGAANNALHYLAQWVEADGQVHFAVVTLTPVTASGTPAPTLPPCSLNGQNKQLPLCQ